MPRLQLSNIKKLGIDREHWSVTGELSSREEMEHELVISEKNSDKMVMHDMSLKLWKLEIWESRRGLGCVRGGGKARGVCICAGCTC